jgi:hypothetical protein
MAETSEATREAGATDEGWAATLWTGADEDGSDVRVAGRLDTPSLAAQPASTHRLLSASTIPN